MTKTVDQVKTGLLEEIERLAAAAKARGSDKGARLEEFVQANSGCFGYLNVDAFKPAKVVTDRGSVYFDKERVVDIAMQMAIALARFAISQAESISL